MTLNQALAIGNARKGATPLQTHFLVCGFEPLHLATLLRGHLLEKVSGDVTLAHGVYGDFIGNLEAALRSDAIAAAVVAEWSDIDPRLGLRASGGWTLEVKTSILTGAETRYRNILTGLERLAARMPVALAAPSLPLPPIGGTGPSQRSSFELELEQQLASFLLRASHLPGVRVVKAPPGAALDARMELMAGFPYTVAFADVLASSLAGALWPAAPKKGLITDLDDTLWRGLVGEIGPAAICWSQESHTQQHGLYQQMLGHLASHGVLVAICSKNDLKTVDEALARRDLFVSRDAFFPVCASWGPKSASVAQIISTWNIGADSVVFVDDNLMEIEEVRAAFPQITGLHFNGKDPNAVWNLLEKLRDLFGKPILTEEDKIRQASIRAGAEMKEIAGEEAGSPEFLRGLQGSVTLAWHVDPADKRPLELINKTNQFNLNGRRIGEGEWRRDLESAENIVTVVSYQDKFGPLGKVAVLKGVKGTGTVHVTHWVMSCRAFSRNLEHHTLDGLFRQTNASGITFEFQPTEKNTPLQEFFRAAGIEPEGDGVYRLSRAAFQSRFDNLPHEVIDLKQ